MKRQRPPGWLLLALLAVACSAGDDAGGDDKTTDAAGVAADAPDVTTESDGADGDLGLTDQAAGPADGTPGPDSAGVQDAAQDDGPGEDAAALPCPPSAVFDYQCKAGDPKTCPGGSCLFGMCIGPVLDPLRWQDCGDGLCAACETAQGCPADCGAAPKLTGQKVWQNDTTVTIWVHGFTNKTDEKLAKTLYGEVKGCGDLFEMMQKLGVDRPCGDTAAGEDKPNQLIAVEYYGTKPAPWLSAQDVQEIEKYPFDKGALGLQRYALVVAKFARWRLKSTGATHINFACHSMGCLIIRHLMENDYEQLASEQKIVRWFSNTGVIAGARLARLYDNPAIQQGAKALGLELSDFVLMNPDYVMDTTAAWDHKLYAGNNPLFGGVLIHHSAATDPKIAEALGIQLLDLNNPGDEPNDGIMYTLDQYFHSQTAAASATTKTGQALPSTRSYGYYDHMTNPGTWTAGILGVAALVGKRKVIIRLAELEVLDDLEQANLLDFSQAGQPPADVAAEVVVRYDPWASKKLGKAIAVSEQRIAHRSAELLQVKEGQTVKPGMILYAGPVADDMNEIQLQVSLLESDWYPRFGVKETVPGIGKVNKAMVDFSGAVALQNKSIEVKGSAARMVMQVTVHDMY